PQRVGAVDQFLKAAALAQDGELALLVLVDLDPGARHDRGLALPEGLRLRDLRRLGDADRQIALSAGDGADPRILAHDDDPGTLVDDHLRNLVRADAELLDRGQQGDAVAAILRRDSELHGAGIERLGDRAEGRVDGAADALRSGEVRIAQRDLQRLQVLELEVELALDDRAVGDAAAGRHALADRGGGTFRFEAADGDLALRYGINLAVGAEEGRHQQRAAEQAGRIAQGADVH